MAGNGVVTKVAEKPKVKLALTEAERTRLKALKAKGEAKLTESEKKELGALRKKIVEAAVKASEGGKGYAKPPKVGVVNLNSSPIRLRHCLRCSLVRTV